MISTCANPACKKPFHYLRGGRLYRFDSPCPGTHSEDVPNAVYATNRGRCAVFFWLCNECASTLSLKFNGRELTIVPLTSRSRRKVRQPIVAIGEWEISHDKVAEDNKVSPVGSTETPAALNTR